MRKVLPLLGAWLFLSILYAGFFLLSSWPWHPRTALGWLVIFLATLPLALFAQFLWEFVVLEGPIGRRLDALGPGGSGARIAYALVCALLMIAVGLGVFAWLSSRGWLGAL
jgi:hypothetical protein